MAVAVAGVIMVMGGVSKLLGSGGLGTGVKILDLGLAEDATNASISAYCPWQPPGGASVIDSHVGVAVWRLIDFRVVDDKQDLHIIAVSFWFQPHCDSLSGPLPHSESLLEQTNDLAV